MKIGRKARLGAAVAVAGLMVAAVSVVATLAAVGDTDGSSNSAKSESSATATTTTTTEPEGVVNYDHFVTTLESEEIGHRFIENHAVLGSVDEVQNLEEWICSGDEDDFDYAMIKLRPSAYEPNPLLTHNAGMYIAVNHCEEQEEAVTAHVLETYVYADYDDTLKFEDLDVDYETLVDMLELWRLDYDMYYDNCVDDQGRFDESDDTLPDYCWVPYSS